MSDDFNPVIGTREVPHVTGNRQDMSVIPTNGAHCAIILLTASSNKPAISVKLKEIEALCDTFELKKWSASSLPGKSAEVKVLARVSKSKEVEGITNG